MVTLNAELLHSIAPHFEGERATRQAAIIGAIGPVLAGTLGSYAITCGTRAAHFLAQICHESDGFCTTTEYASGKAYEGRKKLGNTEPGDGVRYKGRGLIQLTGRANYQKYGDILLIDLIARPELAAIPQTSLVIACEFWTQNGLNTLADNDDITGITKVINGGLNGLEDRSKRLRRAKEALGLVAAPVVSQHPVRHPGHNPETIATIQKSLLLRGYVIKVDGHFGPATEVAVRHFQRSIGLPPDGHVGPATWAAMNKAVR